MSVSPALSLSLSLTLSLSLQVLAGRSYFSWNAEKTDMMSSKE
jgi:hypothetical protein